MRDAAPTARVGTTLAGKYTLNRLLGAGGMGAVFEAVNTWTERRVAVKILHGDAAHNAELAARFLREARAASRIQHANILDVLDAGHDPADGTLFLVTEFLDGTDLRHVLDQRGALPVKDTVEIVAPVMAALVAAHQRGVIHRDVKPENVFLAKTSAGIVPTLVDFGIARLVDPGDKVLTRTGSAIGTPLYMSPEQAKGEHVTIATDIWAVGIVLFECLAGRVPFDGPNYNAVMAKILMEPVPRLDSIMPGVPTALADVVSHALERDPSRRFGSMQHFLGELLDCPTHVAEQWNQTLRTTHRVALTPSSADAPMPPADDLTVTPKIAEPASSLRPYSEGRSWMAPDLQATTLGRTAREISAPSTSRNTSRLVAGAVALAAVGALAFVIATTAAHRHTTTMQSASRAVMPVIRPTNSPTGPANAPVTAALTPVEAVDASVASDASAVQQAAQQPVAATHATSSTRPTRTHPTTPHSVQRGRNGAAVLDQ